MSALQVKVSEIRNKNSHHKWITDRVTEDTEGYLKSDLQMTFESFQTLIYNEIMGCIKRDYIYSLLYECVNYVSIYLWADWNFSGPFYLSFDVFFLSVNLLLWQEPWKKGKLIVKKPVPGSSLKEKNLLACMADSKRALFARVFTAPTLICASRVAPCHQTKRLIVKRIHAYFTLVLRGITLNVVGHACS